MNCGWSSYTLPLLWRWINKRAGGFLQRGWTKSRRERIRPSRVIKSLEKKYWKRSQLLRERAQSISTQSLMSKSCFPEMKCVRPSTSRKIPEGIGKWMSTPPFFRQPFCGMWAIYEPSPTEVCVSCGHPLLGHYIEWRLYPTKTTLKLHVECASMMSGRLRANVKTYYHQQGQREKEQLTN